MSSNPADTEQSCEALLQGLNEDYQVFSVLFEIWRRLFLCLKRCCRGGGQSLLRKVLNLISMIINSKSILKTSM